MLHVLLVMALLPADAAQETRDFSAKADAALARGEYETAIAAANRAYEADEERGRHADAAWDLNAIGLANQYLGRYAAAMDAYTRALALDRASGSGDGEITRLNNIGNVHFLQGRYSDALALYETALRQIGEKTSQRERGRLRKMTLSNLAVLSQRLGADRRALDFYAQIASSETMQPAEEAQLLVNRGALVRRMGDPHRALDLYARAQRLFATAEHRDGEIGAWRNIGIAYAIDLHDSVHALDAFDAALRLARASSNRRGIVQALLYRGEALRRAGRTAEAGRDLHEALDLASSAGLVEERWKALYSIGLLRVERGDRQAAATAFEAAIAAIESVRSDIRSVPLRSEFLADKRDVYDALIGIRAASEPVDAPELFRLIEQSRARTWRDRLSPAAGPPPLRNVQAALPDGTALLEYWSGPDTVAVLTITNREAAATVRPFSAAESAAVGRFTDAVSGHLPEWRAAAARAGMLLLPRLDATVRRLVIVPDAPLQLVPFDALVVPGTGQLALERVTISYVPSAAVLARPAALSHSWRWPWQRTLLAMANPSGASTSAIETRSAAPLPFAAEEARRIAAEVPGASAVYLGAAATKTLLTNARVTGAPPVVHIASHAVADMRDPERSRILLAPAQADGPPDYLFLREVYDLDLSRAALVTLSACDTERGKPIRGEGVEGFGRALLAAGSRAAVTTLWAVPDRAGAEFMTQFYYFLARHDATGDALRSARLQFLHSAGPLSHPYYWAGYVLSGDGAAPLPRVAPWSALLASVLLAAAAATAGIRAAVRRTRSASLRRTSAQTHPPAPTR